MELLQPVMPPGVVQTLSGGNDFGRWMSEHDGIRKISFTGSTPTGRRVFESAADTLKHLTLELGGNDAAIVLPDADVEAIAAMIIGSSMSNTGQVRFRLSPSRLYVRLELVN
jgi:aldehyde dehydrogenase (NAD+)